MTAPFELLLLRHAKSSWKHEGLSDHERPLNRRGREAAPRMGELLRALDMVPGVVLCSTATRARETAELACAAAGIPAERVIHEDALYLAAPETIVDVVRYASIGEPRVMVVAHNPGLEQLAAHWSGLRAAFPTAALARFGFDLEEWTDLHIGAPATPMGRWLPRELEP